jgi:hypothetical protein
VVVGGPKPVGRRQFFTFTIFSAINLIDVVFAHLHRKV